MVPHKRKRTSTTKAAVTRTAASSTVVSKKSAKSAKRANGKTKTKTKATRKKSVKVAAAAVAAAAVVAPPASPAKSAATEPATEASSHTGSTTTATKLTNKKRKGQVPVRLIPHANMPIARFNLAMDPWCEYNLAQVFDQGVEREKWTSYRLNTNVLLLETARERYELVRVCNALARPTNAPRASLPDISVQDKFELYRVVDARRMDDQVIASLPRPLPSDLKELVLCDLDWSEFMWGESSVQVQDVVLRVTCMCFVPRTEQGDEQQAKQIIDMQCPPPSLPFAASGSATAKSTHTIRVDVSLLSQEVRTGVKRSLATSVSASSEASSVDDESHKKRHKPTQLVSTADVSRVVAVATR